MSELIYKKIVHKLTGVVRIKAIGACKGEVLLSYLTEPFLLSPDELERVPHTNMWECIEIARLFSARGYNVDVINWKNTAFIPKKNYSYIFDVHQNIERLLPYLPKDCWRIFLATGCHWLFQNSAEYQRLIELRDRRGIVLSPQRNVPAVRGIEHADHAIGYGNTHTFSTYNFAKKAIRPIPVSATAMYGFNETKDYEKVRKNYVWIGGGGAVHKGLDLVLEAFAAMPEYHLSICGPFAAEKDFTEAYHKELYKTPNITALGRMDVRGEEFKQVVNNAVALIYPSSSEGQAGSVIAGMHAGLIPLISRASGVDVDGFGTILQNCSIEEIKNTVRATSALPADQLKKRSKDSWEYARKHHTREAFTREFSSFLNDIDLQ